MSDRTPKIETTMQARITMTPATLADVFCRMDDEAQAQFFIECARIAETWGGNGPWWQWDRVGGHLRDCQCSTPEARQMIRNIADGMSEVTP